MSAKNLIVSLAVIIALLWGCSDSKKPEELSFDELAPASEKYGEGKQQAQKEELNTNWFDSISPFSKRLVDSLALPHEGLLVLDTLIFPDRFGALKSEKWAVKTGKDSLVFMYWKFKDSIKTENTFFNWLDCYGPKCRSIHVGDATFFSKRAHLFLVQGHYLMCFESGRELNLERILALMDFEFEQKERKFIALQQPRKKTVWKKRDKTGKLLDFQEKIQ